MLKWPLLFILTPNLFSLDMSGGQKRKQKDRCVFLTGPRLLVADCPSLFNTNWLLQMPSIYILALQWGTGGKGGIRPGCNSNNPHPFNYLVPSNLLGARIFSPAGFIYSEKFSRCSFYHFHLEGMYGEKYSSPMLEAYEESFLSLHPSLIWKTWRGK